MSWTRQGERLDGLFLLAHERAVTEGIFRLIPKQMTSFFRHLAVAASCVLASMAL